ncbi:hypothetical protein FRB99_003748 [Tulasnella sp. 403]|nr:hypothetical protein FRB99_003748 [Tulasnella sp. 403]
MSIPYEDPDDSTDNCNLLDQTGLIVQGVMGALVVLSLVYKRQRETPMRPWRIWLFDVSKQVTGQGVIHLLNIGISAWVSRPSSGNNPCAAYFMNVTIDVTLGVGIIWLVLHGLTNFLTNRLQLEGFESGYYGSPPSLVFWARQASVYIVAVVSMKLAVLALLTGLPALLDIGDWILSWTGGNINLQLVFVMGIYPIIMNVVQFWIIDSIVKASPFLPTFEPVERGTSADREPLVNGNGDSDDDASSQISRRPFDVESQSPVRSGSSSIRPTFTRSRSQSSIHSTSSEPKSLTTTYRRMSRTNLPPPILTHDYPPTLSQRPSPLASPASFRHRRSPPPSPSPSTTPQQYGSTTDSPRMRTPDPSPFGAGYTWEEDKTSNRADKTLVYPRSPRATPRRTNNWSLPMVSPSRPSVTIA